jgi:hypothetical protein
MLAYVFRHWPKLTVSSDSYEESLTAFHAAMKVNSAVFRVEKASWLPAGRTGYEDWYLLETAAYIDGLNEAAVSGARTEPHNRAAAMAQTGIGALYTLAAGQCDLTKVAQATWFSKPRGVPYDAFYQRLEPWAQHAPLFRRQMVLGPPPEFGLLDPHQPLPTDLRPVTVGMARVYP